MNTKEKIEFLIDNCRDFLSDEQCYYISDLFGIKLVNKKNVLNYLYTCTIDINHKLLKEDRICILNYIWKYVNFFKNISTSYELFKNTVWCFTGFRDENIKDMIERAGGKVTYNWNKNVTHLISKDMKMTSKVNKAVHSYVPIFNYIVVHNKIRNLAYGI